MEERIIWQGEITAIAALRALLLSLERRGVEIHVDNIPQEIETFSWTCDKDKILLDVFWGPNNGLVKFAWRIILHTHDGCVTMVSLTQSRTANFLGYRTFYVDVALNGGFQVLRECTSAENIPQ